MTSMPINIPQSKIPCSNEGNFQDDDDPPLTQEDFQITSPSSSYPPTIYRPPRYHALNSSPITQWKRPALRIPRKCAYIIATMKPELFISVGAEIISTGVYILPRSYTGNSNGETCAVIGVDKKYIYDLLDRDTEIYNILRTCPQLKTVSGIENLGPYKLTALKCMLKFLYFVYDRELILFNIEPKGSAHNERRYPCANICLPGGGMEFQDEYSWEKAAAREFQEEVGLKLPDFASSDIKLITKQRFNFPDRQAMYFFLRVKKFIPGYIREAVG